MNKMFKAEPEQTLMGYLGVDIVRKATETRLFGGPYMRFINFLQVVAFLYETGAILGRAKRDKVNILEKMLGEPEREGELIKLWQEKAKERLEKFGKEPDSFLDFIYSTELAELGLSLTGFPDLKTMRKTLGEKFPATQELELTIKIHGLEGIGFGSSFADLTEKMVRNLYEKIDMDKWSEARAHGVALPEKPRKISFEGREEEVLTEVANYTRQYFPKLLKPLGF